MDVVSGGHPETVLESHEDWVPGLEAGALDSRLVCHQVQYHVYLGEVGVTCDVEITCVSEEEGCVCVCVCVW